MDHIRFPCRNDGVTIGMGVDKNAGDKGRFAGGAGEEAECIRALFTSSL